VNADRLTKGALTGTYYIPVGKGHVPNCNCDYDCDDRGYFECSTDPRCRQLRDEQMGWTE
jgi:hypothetical protein